MSQFGLIFDMDGLIFDTERILVRCWCQAAAEFGYSMQIQHALAVRSLTWCLAEAYLKRELGATFPIKQYEIEEENWFLRSYRQTVCK